MLTVSDSLKTDLSDTFVFFENDALFLLHKNKCSIKTLILFNNVINNCAFIFINKFKP